jgi:hypothetical protein
VSTRFDARFTTVILDSLAAAALPNVTLRVVPFSAGLHHGVMSGPFVILRFPPNGDGRDSEPATIYIDGFTGALYLDKPAKSTDTPTPSPASGTPPSTKRPPPT